MARRLRANEVAFVHLIVGLEHNLVEDTGLHLLLHLNSLHIRMVRKKLLIFSGGVTERAPRFLDTVGHFPLCALDSLYP